MTEFPCATCNGSGRVSESSDPVTDQATTAADARLITAAPALLEALRALLAAVEADAFQHFEGQGLGPVEEQARAAIRLAEGE